MKSLISMTMAVLALGLLAGCASQIKSDVTHFHALDDWRGKTVRIIPKDNSDRGGLEFKQYAELIGSQLAALGFRPAAEGESPDYEVRVAYAVSDGETVIRSYGYGYAPYYHHGFYGFHGFHHSPFHSSLAYGYGGPQSYMVFTRRLEVDIIDPDSSNALFEGTVNSQGANNRLHEVMPALVQAMFAEFPGESGATRRVVVETTEGGSSY